MRLRRLLAASAAACALLSGCTQGQLPGRNDLIDRLPANSDVVNYGGVSLQVVGTCGSNNGHGMYLKGSGLPPNSTLRYSATYPNGQNYSYLKGVTPVDKNGHPTSWNWNCSTVSGDQTPDASGMRRDPPGEYTVTFMVPVGGQEVPVEVKFHVSY